jgi:hypothetical protein
LLTTIALLLNPFNGSLRAFHLGAKLVGYFCQAGLGVYNVGIPYPQKTSNTSQLDGKPSDVRSVAESLALRDMESAKRYVGLYLSGNRGLRN